MVVDNVLVSWISTFFDIVMCCVVLGGLLLDWLEKSSIPHLRFVFFFYEFMK